MTHLKRILALFFLAASLSSASLGIADQVVRVGFLRAEAPDVRLDYFRNGMRKLGYVEGRNLVIEQRWASGNLERLPGLARELVDLKVDIIVVTSTPGTAAVKNATKTIPVVIAASADPVASGLVESLGRPGGNITGLTLMLDELSTKRLEVLKEIAPNVKRPALLWSASNPVYARMIPRMVREASDLGMQLEPVKVHRPSELDTALKMVIDKNADALYVFEDPVTLAGVAKIVAFAAQARLPAVYGEIEFVRHGGLVSYAPSHEYLFERAAWYVDRILKGAKPADFPIEQPSAFSLGVNLKAANALKLPIPQSILLRADEVIR
jgi:putative ABC transport system substrate-binding protein